MELYANPGTIFAPVISLFTETKAPQVHPPINVSHLWDSSSCYYPNGKKGFRSTSVNLKNSHEVIRQVRSLGAAGFVEQHLADDPDFSVRYWYNPGLDTPAEGTFFCTIPSGFAFDVSEYKAKFAKAFPHIDTRFHWGIGEEFTKKLFDSSVPLDTLVVNLHDTRPLSEFEASPWQKERREHLGFIIDMFQKDIHSLLQAKRATTA